MLNQNFLTFRNAVNFSCQSFLWNVSNKRMVSSIGNWSQYQLTMVVVAYTKQNFTRKEMARLPKRYEKKKWKPNWPEQNIAMDNWLCAANNSSSHNTQQTDTHTRIFLSRSMARRELVYFELCLLVFCCISADSFICTTAFSSEKLYNFTIGGDSNLSLPNCVCVCKMSNGIQPSVWSVYIGVYSRTCC